ncbi:MAG: hypothetical protein MIN69_00200 [Methylorubrum extorquens]|jgi:hypothetical protein|uniref:hypothetical protein n=1 Tax=Methylorubrum extorquens TaxID=408 RepID=UPI002FEE3103
MSDTRERLSPEERAMRQRKLLTIGTYLYGPSWQQALSSRLKKVVERDVPRVRINQWATGAKPVPKWMLPVLADVARGGVTQLRRRAEVFDRIAAGEDIPPSPDEDASPAASEPSAPEEPEQESGPAALSSEEDFDTAAFLDQVLSEQPRALGIMPTFVPEMHVAYSNVEGRTLRQTRRS